ncbi:MAG: class I SAM-dependent methyltransferase [Chloroflexota bacterium]
MPSYKQLFWKVWYPFLTRRMGKDPITFLNYGFWPPEGETVALHPDDEVNRPAIQLYHHVASGDDLKGKNVLEVSCGHGGGASFIKRYHNPGSYIAIDLNPNAIEHNRRAHNGLGIDFRTGNAQVLDFPADHFDAVVNVEASHCYLRQEEFFNSVYRVLRPGGKFLYADFRTAATEPQVERDIREAGFRIIEKIDITAHVVSALRRNTPRYRAIVRQLSPKILLPYMEMFAGLEGSLVYRMFVNREYLYFSYVLAKGLN